MNYTEKDGWISDENGNRASIKRWGTVAKAQESLASLSDCSACSDCSHCSNCYSCSHCSRCSRCSRCSHCSRCSRCSHCSRCSDCSDCSHCSNCYSCSDCSACSACSNCYSCSDCSDKGAENGALIHVPIIKEIHKRVYAAASAPEALQMDSWHTCETTHCRAGWVVTLAGAQGKGLESKFGTLLAAMKIYDASDADYKINPCRFFDDNQAALEDMRKLAEVNE